MTVQSILGVSFLILFDCYCFVLYFWHMVALPSYVTDHRDLMEDWVGQDCKGCAGCIRVECMIRPPKMAILLLSVHPLLDQCLLHLHPTHLTELPKYSSHLSLSW